MSLYNELPIVFPWYEKQEQQDRYRENVDGTCSFKLISPKNSLLPFQFRKPKTLTLPNSWEIFEAQSMASVAVITGALPDVVFSSMAQNDYFTFPGTPIAGLTLAPGYYFSIMRFPEGSQYYSEVFFVPDSGAFNVQDDDFIPFLKFVFYNNNDMPPILYAQESPSGGSFFKQVFYLDSFITASEPEIVEDGTKDGNDELIPTFQKAIINYRITTDASEFLKKAISLLPMCDSLDLTTKLGIRTGPIEKITVDSVPEGNGAISIVDLVFQETVAIIKKGCGNDMATGCSGGPTTMVLTEGTPNTFYKFQGYAAPGTVVQFYGSQTVDGPKTIISGLTATAAEYTAGVQLLKVLFDPFVYISAKAMSLGCDFGFSTPAIEKIVTGPPRLTLIYDDILNVPVSDPNSLTEWNAFFNTSFSADADFNVVEVSGNIVNLGGPTAMQMPGSLFYLNTHIMQVLDYTGIVTLLQGTTFYQCPILEKVVFNGVAGLGASEFVECPLLQDAIFPVCTVMAAGNQFYHCVSLTKADFPLFAGVVPINSFYVCPALAEINFPLCTGLADFAFSNNACTVVSFPLATSIGLGALGNCPNLKSVSLPVCTSIGDSSFRPSPALETLFLPACTNVGTTTGDDLVFNGTTGRTIALVLKSGTETDADIVYLLANNTVTLTLV
jgi:hypothetical protein